MENVPCRLPCPARKKRPKKALLKKLLSTLLVTACLQVTALAHMQDITLNLTDAPLEKVFSEIKKQSPYLFIYNTQMLQGTKPVTIKIKNAKIEEVLDACFNGQPLSFEMDGHTVIITPKKSQLSAIPLVEVSGIVKDETNNSIESATVVSSLTGKITLTNRKGEFNLKAIEDDDVLVISSVGYEEQKIAVKGKTLVEVKLKIAVKGLDETMVIAYGKTSRRISTGSVSKVSAGEIASQPVSNPLAALAGRVPGLLVTQTSGVPGAAFKLQIRGQSSLDLSLSRNDPLIVIDGVPFEPGNTPTNQVTNAANTPRASDEGGLSALNSISPSDIESIEILKDADATAIYGSRGANGVLLITTKQAKPGSPVLTASTYTGFGKVTRRLDLLDTKQYLSMRREAFRNDGIEPDANNAPDLFLWDTTRYTDFGRMLGGGTSSNSDVQASLSGGNSQTRFLAGGNFHRETNIFPGDDADKRISAHVSINHSSADKRFSMMISAIYSSDKNNMIQYDPTQYQYLPPNMKLYGDDGQPVWEEGGFNIGNLGYSNPMATLLQKYSGLSEVLASSLALAYKLSPTISFNTTLGYNSSVNNEVSITPGTSINLADRAYTKPSSNFGNSSLKSWIIEPNLLYNTIIGKGAFQLMAGASLQQKTQTGTSISAMEYSSDLLLYSLSAAGITYNSNNYSNYKYAGFYGKINYNWNRRYIINISGRRDGSSRFAPENRATLFGAAGAAWLFANENFIKNTLPFIDYGKIRASYGITGNDQIGDYKFLELWGSSFGTYQGTSGLSPSTLYNPTFEWEKNKKLEAAIELDLFKSRISVSAAWYRHRSSNQLISYKLPTQTGFSTVIKNFPALVQNTGIELAISSKNINTKLFQWETGLTLTIPRNKLVSFPGLESSSYSNQYIIGQSLNVINAYRYTGVEPQTGIYSFEDVNKDGAITYPNDLQVLGNYDPKYYGGLRNSFQYKHISLDVFFQFTKQEGRNYLAIAYAYTPGGISNQPVDVLDRWQKPGDIATYQQYTQASNGEANMAAQLLSRSNGIYSDASFIRLKNVSLSYELPLIWLRKISLSRLKIFAEAQNLLTITSYKGTDPENQNYYQLPPLKTVVFGLQLSL